jgi:hypothetical protein
MNTMLVLLDNERGGGIRPQQGMREFDKQIHQSMKSWLDAMISKFVLLADRKTWSRKAKKKMASWCFRKELWANKLNPCKL